LLPNSSERRSQRAATQAVRVARPLATPAIFDPLRLLAIMYGRRME
jgi:hypothetical protein